MNLISFSQEGLIRQAIREITAENEYLRTYGGGLVLSEKDARMLCETRTEALKTCGRVEFGAGSIQKLIRAFATSEDITKSEFPSVLADLIDIFYAYKNDTDFKISDDELIHAMRVAFDGSCHGSVELLATKGAQAILRLALSGEDTPHEDDAPINEAEDEE